MKHITKHSEPAAFTTWKVNNPAATYKDDLDREREIKKELKNSLLKEQHYLCCYCECRIRKENSHIEHFKPKGDPKYAHLQLEYNNLHASCGKDRSGKKEEHCGHKKYNEYQEELISPLEPHCATHFTYNTSGEIGYTSKRGRITIDLLNLNSALLKTMRKKLIDYFLIELDDNEVNEELKIHLDTTKVEFGEFYTMIEYLSAQKLI